MNEGDKQNLKFAGLHPLPEDERDFSLAGMFKQIDIKEVPMADFIVAEPLVIKDQDETDFCSAYTVTEVSEDQEGKELLPEYQFYKTKLLMGDKEWGADLRTAFKSAVRFGSLPVKGHEQFKGISRETVLNDDTWPEHLDQRAIKQRKETFFKVDGRYDTFDNIRATLWQFRAEKRTVGVGALWRASWTYAEGGIIKDEPSEGQFGHAFKIYGQKIINGQPYLVAQLSNGTDIGDGGKFYFPREVVNREFTRFGQFMFKDIERDIVEMHQDLGIQIGDSLAINTFKKLCALILHFFKR